MITAINQVQKKIDDTDKKTAHTSDFVKKKTDYNAKITKIECKILSIIGLATTTALAVVKNKILNVSNLAKNKNRI